jgi:C-5 cytosine-specific DNA methylase
MINYRKNFTELEKVASKFWSPELSRRESEVASDANRLGVYHKGRIRRITPREAARLQAFPDSFILHENDDKAYYQLGNSVSINVVKAVVEEVLLNLVNSKEHKSEISHLMYCENFSIMNNAANPLISGIIFVSQQTRYSATPQF